jgi:signal recognition particle GTPase
MASTSASYLKSLIHQSNENFLKSLNSDSMPVYPLIYTKNMLYNNNSSNYINSSKNVKKTLTKYYFYKIIDKWIYDDLFPLLGFVKIINDKPELIKNLSDYDVEKLAKDSDNDIESKINYMEKILITKDMVYHVLKKIVKSNNIMWNNLNKNEKLIKKIFYEYIVSKLKDAIKNID